MIARIEGLLSAVEERAVIVQVGGIGFRVYVPGSFLAQCGAVGSEIALHTHLHVREDELTLYGFPSQEELHLFKLLLSVSGVGPRVAMGMLSAMTVDTIRRAIAGEQVNVLSGAPGVGTKTAKKIILDLKDKVGEGAEGTTVPTRFEDAEVIAALTTLGYSVVEAQTALQHVPPTARSVEERLRLALTYLGT